jgi:predicted HAD superfamily Cof-like phosphohydrolase
MESNFDKVKKYMDLTILIDKQSFFKKDTICNPNTCDHQLDVLQNQFLVTEEALKIRDRSKITRSFIDLLYDIYTSSIVLNIDINKEFDKVYGTQIPEKSFAEKFFSPCMCVDPVSNKQDQKEDNTDMPPSLKKILDDINRDLYEIDASSSISK